MDSGGNWNSSFGDEGPGVLQAGPATLLTVNHSAAKAVVDLPKVLTTAARKYTLVNAIFDVWGRTTWAEDGGVNHDATLHGNGNDIPLGVNANCVVWTQLQSVGSGAEVIVEGDTLVANTPFINGNFGSAFAAFNVATGDFTCRREGVYSLTINSSTPTVAGVHYGSAIYYTDVTATLAPDYPIARQDMNPAGADSNMKAWSCAVNWPLHVGDIVRMKCSQQSGSTLNLTNNCSIVLMGDIPSPDLQGDV